MAGSTDRGGDLYADFGYSNGKWRLTFTHLIGGGEVVIAEYTPTVGIRWIVLREHGAFRRTVNRLSR